MTSSDPHLDRGLARGLEATGLTPQEYDAIVGGLGRTPNPTELALFGVLWSEHCSYKTSRALLRQLPTTAPHVLQGPGENAGVIDLGGGLACCFKIESHNHPSAIEPVQGAATGVGGILRDVFAMGARPVALLDALAFGELAEGPQAHLGRRVVEGIAWYGNCVGIPTVGGELVQDAGYRDNCLVNAMCVGLARPEGLIRARAEGPGNPVLLVGSDTGRDGIGGAAFASAEFDEHAAERRPAVQVGNPFLEKCLLEACQELVGDPDLVALQDCGAAGLTSSCAEMAHRGGMGLDLDVSRVSRREQGMTPVEVMLSESQERMVLVVSRGAEARVAAGFARWGLHTDAIGTVRDHGRLRIADGTEPVADLPLSLLVDGSPERRPPAAPPADRERRLAADPLADPLPCPAAVAWQRILEAGNCASAEWVWRQYDHMVGDDTVAGPGGDAAVVRLRGRDDALALTVDGGHRCGAYAPRRAAAIAVAEASRNCAVVGATPLAVTNCLNFGSPDRPEVMWQLEEAISGLADACRALGLPVVSGNVSLYNDTLGRSIPPTPVVGVVGRLASLAHRIGIGFAEPGLAVVLLGPPDPSAEAGGGLGASEYQRVLWGRCEGPAPHLDLDLEARVQEVVRRAAIDGLLRSAHDCARGGLAVALTESCVSKGVGAHLRPPAMPAAPPGWLAAYLFGEAQSRVLVSCDRDRAAELGARATAQRVPHSLLGVTAGPRLALDGVVDLALSDLASWWHGALPRLLQEGVS